VRLGGRGRARAGGATAAAVAAEEEGGQAESRPRLGEREEPCGVGRAQRGLEAGCGGREVAPALSLVGQREEAVRQGRHGGQRKETEQRSEGQRLRVQRGRGPAVAWLSCSVLGWVRSPLGSLVRSVNRKLPNFF
jgi:hypothetical protein